MLPRKLLVLDLDETLIHARETPLERIPDFYVGPYCVYRRPHLAEFIDYAIANFDVAVWTSSGRRYARGVVEAIFPPDVLRFLYAAENCTITRDWDYGSEVSLKKFAKLRRRGFDLEQVIAVDDTPQKHAKNYGNLVRVREFNGEPDDDELLLLPRYLERLKQVPNVRAVEKRRWRFEV